MANLAAVVGIGQTKYTTKRQDVSIAGLVREAAVNALQDADLTWDDIDLDRQLILLAPSSFAEDTERQREIGNSAMASFIQLITAGVNLGDVRREFSPEILAAMVVGTLNMLTICRHRTRIVPVIPAKTTVWRI